MNAKALNARFLICYPDIAESRMFKNTNAHKRYRTYYLAPIVCILSASLYGLTSAFSLTPWANFSIIGASVIGLLAIITIIRGEVNISTSEYVILIWLGMLLSIAISFAVTDVTDAEKSINHTLARLFTSTVLFLLPYLLFNGNKQLAESMRAGLILGALVSISLIAYDFFRLNGYLDLGVVSHLETGDELDATHRVYIYRARGGSVEPGHDASVIAAILPLVVDRMKERWRLISLFLIGAVVYFLGYSTSLILWGFVFSIVYSLMNRDVGVQQRIWSLIRITIVSIGILVFLSYYDLVDDLEGKFESVSFEGRAESLDAIFSGIFSNLKTALFGIGPGGYVVLGVFSITNTFAALLLDCGLFGALFYILAIFFSGKALFEKKDSLYLAAYIAYLLTFVMAIANYWFPTHWLFLMYPIFARIRQH